MIDKDKIIPDGWGKYHLFKEDHDVRISLAYGKLEDFTDQFENAGGYIP